MKTISKNSDQLSGLIKLILIPVWNIKSIIDLVIQVNDNNFVFLIECSIDTLNHDVKLQTSDAGTYYDHVISAVIAGEHESHTDLDDLARHYVIAIMQTDSGSWVRIGEVGNPLTFTYDFSTKKPGYDFSLAGQLPYKSCPTNAPAF